MFINIVYCCACHENDSQPGQTTSVANTASRTEPIVKESADTSLYGIRLSETLTLSLQQWDSTLDLPQHLGKPLKQKTRELDRNSDTFSGSFIKDLEYDGLKLQLFSPPQNGRTFWVQEIILTSNKYKTTKGVTIGDEWENVKQFYPSIQKFPGANENMYYVANAGYEKSIEMEFLNSKLKKLRMYYMLN